MTNILDGKVLSKQLGETLKEQISRLNKKPRLLIIQIGNRVESNTYIKRKIEFGKYIGAEVIHEKYNQSIKEKELIRKIERFNDDKNIDGIILQLPLPKHLDAGKIIEFIDTKKDVDGQTSKSMKALIDNRPGFIPATTRGIITLLEYNNIKIKGKKVVIVGRSTLVGKPTALAFLNKDATVTICHARTINLKSLTKQADILVVGIGKPNFITKEFVKRGQTVIDIGINPLVKNKKTTLVGDVDFNKVKNLVKKITPVPGGIGPMTILSLFENLLIAHS
jgi:methylenetetrahydrofolate dehydrogenase (NADP+) / methenyltetrahydrofolate cyclohydrolase